MDKKPFLNALAAGAYIVLIVFVVDGVTSSHMAEKTLLLPMIMLSLFVLSAAVMGTIFFYRPVVLFLEDRKTEAALFLSRTLGFFAILVAIALSVFWFSMRGEVDKEISYDNSSSEVITVERPSPGAVVGREFSILGQARGNWFFEADFPVEVLDKNGEKLAMAVATAEVDSASSDGAGWMTTDFVPFRAEVEIPESYFGPATLVLHKDNPSDLPEHDASISFPVIIEH